MSTIHLIFNYAPNHNFDVEQLTTLILPNIGLKEIRFDTSTDQVTAKCEFDCVKDDIDLMARTLSDWVVAENIQHTSATLSSRQFSLSIVSCFEKMKVKLKDLRDTLTKSDAEVLKSITKRHESIAGNWGGEQLLAKVREKRNENPNLSFLESHKEGLKEYLNSETTPQATVGNKKFTT